MENLDKKIWLQNILLQNGLKLENEQLDSLILFVYLLLEKNKFINLISRKDTEFVWENHILHSLAICKYFTIEGSPNILDLGTGGGFPGIPLKIALPKIKIDLLDSIRKKVEAVSEFVEALKLDNASVVCSRTENLGAQFYNKYDIVVSRGVAPLIDLIKWAKPLMNRSSNFELVSNMKNEKYTVKAPIFIAFKGGQIEAEIQSLKLANICASVFVCDISVQGIEINLLQDKKIVLIQF
ncbi:MAG: 16S rRNA (guanine(527)-N(7))-methyltransferase RsmG [Bacteroidota bacterium]|nr:16S rRNA (guanine(527)-N(7))-methyltransferase RsmG [Bacteroidota bacterium]